MTRSDSSGTLAKIDAEIERLQMRKKTRKTVTLLYNPVKTIKTFGSVCKMYSLQVADYLHYHRNLLFCVISLAVAACITYAVPGSHHLHVDKVRDFLFLCIWWVGLGVLSSVGLGTGLHTFVLYLGPHIAKVTLTATECNTVNFATYGRDSFVCPTTLVVGGVTYWAIVRKVQLEALMWGFGTALGELPPYFVARAARFSGMKLEGQDDTGSSGSIFTRLRNMVPSILSHLGFFGILLFASIPNPLFDLAGITCGHFLVPFWKFFGATLIGKAFVKAHLQTVFVVLAFSKEHLEWLVSSIEALVPYMEGRIHPVLERERARLHRTGINAPVTQVKSSLSLAWDTILVLMLFYFITSIVNSSVQDYLIQKDDEKISKKKEARALLEKAEKQ